MGRCLPLLLALSFTLHAQDRRVADRHVTVNLSALAQAVVPQATTQLTPRPAHTSGLRPLRTGGSSNFFPAHAPVYGPAAFTGFLALLDNYGPTPPDTGGAVGPRDVITMLNSQMSVQSRSGVLRPHFPIDLTLFWSGLGSFAKIFDPRILYDVSADRWIAAAAADPGTQSASLLLAVSETGDPTGNWHDFQIAIGKTGVWADYPVLGMNKSWITLSANLLALPPAGEYAHTEIFVIPKGPLYTTSELAYTGYSDTHGQFTPAIDLDRTSDSMYFVQAASGSIRLSRLTGDTFTPGSAEIPTGNAWADVAGTDTDFAPQLGSYYKVDTGDSRLQNCVLRGGSLWCAHTVFLPADKPKRASVHWFQLDPVAGAILQQGMVDDPGNAVFYAYPTIAVNRKNDSVIGYTRFTASDYPAAAFSFRMSGDPLHSLRATAVFKFGEAPYVARGADEGSNRWGDVSATMVDPVDDLSFWTIQEYAAAPTDYYLGRWGTWWANISMPAQAAPQGRNLKQK